MTQGVSFWVLRPLCRSTPGNKATRTAKESGQEKGGGSWGRTHQKRGDETTKSFSWIESKWTQGRDPFDEKKTWGGRESYLRGPGRGKDPLPEVLTVEGVLSRWNRLLKKWKTRAGWGRT